MKSKIAWQTLLSVVSMLTPVIVSPYLTRTLGADRLGIYAYVFAIEGYFALAADLGLGLYGNRLTARCSGDREKLDRVFSEVFSLKFLYLLVAVAAYAAFAFFSARYRNLVWLFGIALLATGCDSSWFYYGLEQFKLPSVRGIALKLLTCVFVFVIVKDENDLWKYALIMALSPLAGNLALFAGMKGRASFIKIPVRDAFSHAVPAFLIFVPFLMQSIFHYADKIMLNLMYSEREVGLYATAEKGLVSQQILSGFVWVFMPRMSALAQKESGADELKKKLASLCELTVLFAVPACLGTMAIARRFAPLFWGADFTESGALLSGLSVNILIFAFIMILQTGYILPVGREKLLWRTGILGIVWNIGLNAWLIPRYGAMGAVAATALTNAGILLILVVCCQEKTEILQTVWGNRAFFVFGLAMFAAVAALGKCLPQTMVMILVQVGAGAALYGSACVIYFRKRRKG
ncbi:MAG: flippase [Clostridium sp.]|jgi:O-antigen/teichoic acid export membrane protein|nr:flippase [Clostridium sp.]